MDAPTQKILFLAPYPFGRVGSQRFRFEQYWDLFPGWGIQAHFHSFLLPADFDILYKEGYQIAKAKAVLYGFWRRSVKLCSIWKYDKIFIHREVAPIGPPVFEWLIANVFRKKIIYDFDDAIWLTNTSEENKLSAALKCHWKVKYICQWAHQVTCGNQFLARFAKQYNQTVTYLPTTLNTKHIPLSTLNSKLATAKLGWTGTHSTLKYLWRLVPLLQKLEKQLDFEFIVIADKDPKLPLKNFRFIRWNKETEWQDLSQIQIGLMPLEQTEWEEGKCGFKALQYMAVGIPAIVSPTGANKEIVQNGENGLICEREEEWEQAILNLISDQAIRQRFVEEGRKTVEERYSRTAWGEGYRSILFVGESTNKG